jgi:hypothetical protein
MMDPTGTLSFFTNQRIATGNDRLAGGLIESTVNDGTIPWANRLVLNRQIVWGNARQIGRGNFDLLAESKQIVWGNHPLTVVGGSSEGPRP